MSESINCKYEKKFKKMYDKSTAAQKELSYELADDPALASVYQRLINTQETLFNYKKEGCEKDQQNKQVQSTHSFNKPSKKRKPRRRSPKRKSRGRKSPGRRSRGRRGSKSGVKRSKQRKSRKSCSSKKSRCRSGTKRSRRSSKRSPRKSGKKYNTAFLRDLAKLRKGTGPLMMKTNHNSESGPTKLYDPSLGIWFSRSKK